MWLWPAQWEIEPAWWEIRFFKKSEDFLIRSKSKENVETVHLALFKLSGVYPKIAPLLRTSTVSV